MALARRVLTVLLAAAVALAPAGVATAAGHSQEAVVSAAHETHVHRHDRGAMPMAASDERRGHHCDHMGAGTKPPSSKPVDHKATGSGCCDGDTSACAETCLQKCFGPLAVIAPARTLGVATLGLFVRRPAERPPGWSAAPQPPPPRA